MGELVPADDGREAGERPLRLLILHWGRTGAGPLLTLEAARAVCAMPGAEVAVSFAAGADNVADLDALPLPRVSVRTYRSAAGVVLGLPRLGAHAWRLRRFIRDHAVDAVFSPMDSLWQSLALHFMVPRSVVYLAGVHDAAAHPGDRHPLKDLCRWLEYRRADVVIAYSRAVATTIAERHLTRAPVVSTVLPAFVSGTSVGPARRSPGGPPVRLGFFGRLLPYKGLDLFVEVVRRLDRSGVPVVGVVHGDGDVAQTVCEAGNTPIEWHVGWVPADKVNSVVASMDVLVLPYREASQSGVLAIALAEGVPVVGTPVGGLAEQITETGCGLVSSSVEPQSVADAIRTLISDERLYREASACGLEAAAVTHTWQRLADDVVRAARGAIPDGGGRQ